MATAGLTCVVRQSLRKFMHPGRVRFIPVKSKVVPLTVLQGFCPCSFYSSLGHYNNAVSVEYRHGLPVFSVPLPSRKENCEFTLKPVTHTVGDFLKFLQVEDGGIDRAAVYTESGNKVARSTTIDVLLRSNFQIQINEDSYSVTPPVPIALSMPSEDLESVNNVKSLISQLYSQMNVEQHQLQQEKILLLKLEDLKEQIEPLEKLKQEINLKSIQRNRVLSWLGLGFMGIQFSLLARLTWWEYSWDIMEPVTYFVTYGTTMLMYAYFVCTRQEYTFVEVEDRQYLLSFYKSAKKYNFDIARYNELRDSIADVEYQLKRLRDPLQIHLPIRELEKY